MSISGKRAANLGILLAGYSAWIAGLLALAIQPLIGVLVSLGGAALAITCAAELIRDPSAPESQRQGK